MKQIEAIYKGGVLIPIQELDIPENSKVIIKIEKVEKMDSLKMYGYLKLLKEGEDATELFEI